MNSHPGVLLLVRSLPFSMGLMSLDGEVTSTEILAVPAPLVL